jgi:hypothetical protein
VTIPVDVAYACPFTEEAGLELLLFKLGQADAGQQAKGKE